MSDVLSASSVFIAIVLSFFQDSISFLKYADKVSGIVISLLIIKTSYNIFKENITAIIGECEHDENVIAKIKDKIMSVSNVLIIDNLTVMKYGSYYQVVLDVGVDEEYKLKDAHNIAHDIEKQLLDGDLNIKYVVVHVNPYRKVSVED